MIRFVLFLILFAGSIAPAASQSPKVHRIGFVSAATPVVPESPALRAFRAGLRDLGYIEGKDVVIELRSGEGRPERLAEHFAEMVRLKVDVLVTGSAVGALTAKKTVKNLPVVFAGVLDPISPGIVQSLAHPGGNMTGTTFGVGGYEMAGKWMELLKEAVPGISRVAVLTNSKDPQSGDLLRTIEGAAIALKVKIELFDAGRTGSLDSALAAVGASAANGLVVANSILFAANDTKLVQFAAARRMPAIYFFNQFPDKGGLMSYGGNLEDTYRRAAALVDKILKGARAGELPIDQPTKFELVINLKTAKALGVNVPKSLLLRADRVIE